MGKILLYRAGRAAISLLSTPSGSIGSGGKRNVNTWKDENGDEYSTWYFDTSSSTTNGNIIYYMSIFNGGGSTGGQSTNPDLKGYASADTEEDFSLDHYTTREIANLTYSRNESPQTAGRIITTQVTNNGSEAVTVNSLKFVKKVKAYPSGSSSASDKNALLWGYFLDSPVTIGVGETKTFALNFDT